MRQTSFRKLDEPVPGNRTCYFCHEGTPAYCEQWKTERMPAPAFWLYCEECYRKHKREEEHAKIKPTFAMGKA